MISLIGPKDVELLRGLLQDYVGHKGDEIRPVDEMLRRYGAAIRESRFNIYVEYDSAKNPTGCIFYNRTRSSFDLIYARMNFDAERALFDHVFAIAKKELDFITFESGYPTPWISTEFSDYVVHNGVKKYDRAYMRLDRTVFSEAAQIPKSIEIAPFSEEQIDDVTHVVFRAVDNTVDQELWPTIYGTEQAALEFHRNIISGNWGDHGPRSSWIAKSGPRCVGVCFMVTQGANGSIMHLAVDPDWRRRGIGRALLTQSIDNLFRENDDLSGVYLAVTLGNPAMQLYESIGFSVVNYSSSYIWKKENH
jgi:ribosomal protein S18 acetylase RimI-like enzyme